MNVSDWESTPIGERRAAVQNRKLYVMNNKCYWFNSGDTYNISSVSDFTGKAIELSTPVQKNGDFYAITKAGDVVIEGGNVYVYTNSGYIQPNCTSAAGNSNFTKVN